MIVLRSQRQKPTLRRRRSGWDTRKGKAEARDGRGKLRRYEGRPQSRFLVVPMKESGLARNDKIKKALTEERP